jgi:Rrf2 family protein
MLHMPKKLLYALEAVVDVAYNARPEPVQSKDITHRQGIPQRYLEQVMQQLVHAGVLKGVRGPRGGYTLARERRRITVGEIVRVVEAADDSLEEEIVGSELGHTVVRPLWQNLRDEAMARLDKVTLEDLCNQARERGIASAADSRHDFTI